MDGHFMQIPLLGRIRMIKDTTQSLAQLLLKQQHRSETKRNCYQTKEKGVQQTGKESRNVKIRTQNGVISSYSKQISGIAFVNAHQNQKMSSCAPLHFSA